MLPRLPLPHTLSVLLLTGTSLSFAGAAVADTTIVPAQNVNASTASKNVLSKKQSSNAQRETTKTNQASTSERWTVTAQGRARLTGISPNQKYTASLLDTPRTVSVITQAQMKLVNATSFEEAMRTVPGISFRGGDAYAIPGGNYPIIRGFGSYSNMFIDGMRDSGVSQREVFDVDQMEVLKGPASVYGGRGGLGGQINITTKKAQQGNITAAQIGFGTADYKRGTFDINRMIGNHTAVRLNAMGSDGVTAGRVPTGNHRWGVAPSVSFGLGTPTRLTLGYYHLYSDGMPDYSAPYSKITHEPLDIPRHTVLGLKNRDFERSTTDMGQVILERDLWSNFVFRNTLQWTSTQYDFLATNPQWKNTNPLDDTILLEAKSGQFHTDNFQEQAMISGKFNTGFIKHSVNFGIEVSRERSTRNELYVRDSGGNNMRNGGPCSIAYNCVSASNLGSWSSSNPWTGSYSVGEPGIAQLNTNVNTGSAYAFDTMSMLHDHLLINGGVRFDRFMTSAVQGNVGLSNNQSFINYQAGIIYKPIKPVSLYFSYATASNPIGVDAGADGQIALSKSNQSLSPQNGKNIEVGAKADLFKNRLSTTFSLFDGKMTNAQVSDGYGNMINAGTQRVRGAEISVAGSLTKRWEVFGGWTYLDSTVINGGPTHANVGKRFPYTPGNSVSFWSTYRILPKFKAGGGLTYMSKRYTNVNNQTWVPEYVRIDLVADYQFTNYLDLQENLQNLTNKRYYDKIYTNYSRIAAGRAVTFQLSLKL
ncbi:MAG: TonB-dependent siderophore receptor [Acetobacter indonesiensis]|nr:TonB-dependent siderophore receptor [Acetobacter indonesiensis]MCI1545444.1 TonB-dependent siderophore receptor [Acetobacter indonesiensis]MCI1764819.1 TonB-dependent siderophore receptor [Acetobacter indonesiensis]